ncbi:MULTISPECIES: hypothetical protein [Pseudomonas]|uniref:hypothetical protein n=1 Tax=Pseudomonas TaxID=286 RepID=UPI00036A1295|nr:MULTISPECIES: hypothetical protein [Pseudomonas]MBU0521647.1 hypothetical protein [Gammaproteobacteria bacterium]MBU0840580.1 hypothetical protein [Gammaproteobacteria bacterium]MBU1838294.1 hypothetical protein [Gammaproteobacteria bacterium]PMV91200.1 hypothetical protein C1X55_31315 [Pseudomonas sp. GW460-C8]PMW23293.1 hypothetical protein C1X53_12065 [Pseudomonas sp. GW456-E6]
MKMIIESEVKRAEVLVEHYMGLPPETIDLFSFNADALRRAPADFGRAITALRQIAVKNNPSQADVAYAVSAVDLIAELAQGQKLPAPIQKLWTVEEGIRNAGGLWTLKHLVTIVLAFAGVLVGSTKTLTFGYEMFAYIALALIIASGALHLTHSKNAEMKVPAFTLGGLGVFCVLNTAYAPSIGFLALLVCAIAFMAGSFLSQLAGTKSSTTGAELYPEDYEPAEALRPEEYNPFKVTIGNDMSEPIDRLS